MNVQWVNLAAALAVAYLFYRYVLAPRLTSSSNDARQARLLRALDNYDPPASIPSAKPTADNTSSETADPQAFLDARQTEMILLRRIAPETTLLPRSRFGGLPLLPDNVDWPRRSNHNTPLHFLAMIDCSEMPSLAGQPPLPPDGLLLFFVDIEEEMDVSYEDDEDPPPYRVIYVPEGATASERALPEDLPPFDHFADSTESDFSTDRQAASWPIVPEIVPAWDLQDSFPPPAVWEVLRERERNAWAPYLEDASARRYKLKGGHHAMLGPTQHITNATSDTGVRLLCLDSDAEAKFAFCDAGVIEFWITPEDLAARNFSKVRAHAAGG